MEESTEVRFTRGEKVVQVTTHRRVLGARPLTERAAWQPQSEHASDGESDGGEGVGKVTLRPRARVRVSGTSPSGRGGKVPHSAPR